VIEQSKKNTFKEKESIAIGDMNIS